MMKKLSDEKIKSARPSLEKLKEADRFPVAVLVENVRSLYNVGSIFRTSDGAFIECLYLCGYTGYPPRKEISKTALGSVETVKWEYNENPLEVISGLKDRGYQIISLEHTDKSCIYSESDYSFPLCLVIGNEVDGISDSIVSMSDLAVEIPMHGLKQSLNVSVAYGIVVYHIVNMHKKSLEMRS